MNGTQVDDTDIVRGIVSSTQETISDVLAALIETDDAASFSNASKSIQAQIKRLGVVAGISGFKGLNAVCGQLCSQLAELPLSSSQEALIINERVNSWLLNILVYLADIQSLENIEQLAGDVTADTNNVCQLLLQDAGMSDYSETITFPQEEHAATEITDDGFHLNDETTITDSAGDDMPDTDIESITSPEEEHASTEMTDDGLNLNDETTITDSAGDDMSDTGIESITFPEEEHAATEMTDDGFHLNDETTITASVNDGALDIDIDDFDSIFAVDDDIDLDGAEGIMAVLCHELLELQPQISDLSQQIVSNDKQAAPAAANTYADIIGRVHNTSGELGLSGLIQVCEFVLKNVRLTLELEGESRTKVQLLLEGWTQVIIDHLQAPADDDLCLAVVDYLEEKSWPEPLKYSEIRDLIDGLTKQLELTGDYEVEARSTQASAEDVSLEIEEDTSQQLHDAFFAESPGYAEELTTRISNITNGVDVQENTKAAQRLSHTLKGSANLIGTKGIANIAHHMEDIFEYLAKQALAPPEPLGYTMQEAADTIEIMIEALQGQSPAPADAQRVLQDVLNWANRIDQGHLTRETDLVVAKEPAAVITIDASMDLSDAPADMPQQAVQPELSQTEFLRVPRNTIDHIFNLIGETSISIGQIQEQLKRMRDRGDDMRQQEKTLQARRFELENLVSVRGMATKQQRLQAVAGDENFDSLEMDQYDEFYGVTHSFIEAVSDTREASQDITSQIMELDGIFLQQKRLNRALQDLVMTTRMVPVKTIVARLQRTVRQACRATGKQAELVTFGDDLLMDGDVLNQLADPLMHLLRNAIDHGIELPAERFELGKPNSGHITLRFYQEGNSIRVTCSDDGAGLDYDRIRGIALGRNIIQPQEQTDNETLARMILSSGFSTRDKATQISGRGVGLDVVHTSVLNLKGNMDIYDNQPSGTTFNIRLPITLLTSHSILIKSGKQHYAIPTSSLEQILPPGTGEFSITLDELSFQLDKNIYVTRSLEQLLGNNNTDNYENNPVLLTRFDNKIYAIVVDSVISSYDLVVKNLGHYIKSVPGITGVSLLGNGNVVPVLDLMQLIDHHNQGKQQVKRSVAADTVEKSHVTKILIVDDSLSVRKSLSQLVQDAGYEALIARDGIEALEVMQKIMPDLILTDLEMPRMTGLELSTHIRSNPENKNLPIIMITSRTMVKHQEQAQKAGVNEYITKPFSEDDLVAKIGEALRG